MAATNVNLAFPKAMSAEELNSLIGGSVSSERSHVLVLEEKGLPRVTRASIAVGHYQHPFTLSVALLA